MPTTHHPRTRHGDGLPLLLLLGAALALLAARGDLPAWPPWLSWPPTTTGADPAGDGGSSGGLGRVVDPLPVGRVSSGFGPRVGGWHYGLDIAAPLGTPIRAVADGVVIEAGPASGFGLWVRIRHHDGTVSVYGHMNTVTTRVDAHVAAGQQIATVGARGQATGPHLHLEVWPGGDRARRVDPAGWMTAHGAPLPGGRTR